MHFFEFKPKNQRQLTQLDELRMNPKSLNRFGSQFGDKFIAGFEAEVIFKDVLDGNNSEEDYTDDPRIRRGTDMSDVEDFFDQNSDRDFRELQSEFDEWLSEAMSNAASEEAQEELEHYKEQLCKKYNETHDEEDWLEPDDFEDEARDQAYEDAFDAINARDDFTFYDFCQDKGYDWMSELANNYGLIWPRFSDTEEGYSESVAQDLIVPLERDLDAVFRVNDQYHGGRAEGVYVMEPDSSIEPDDKDSDMGAEIVSPPMPLPQMLQQLEQCLSTVQRLHGYTNESTGLHINMSIPKMELDYVKLALFSGDSKVLADFERLSNTYCIQAIERINNRVRYEAGLEGKNSEYIASIMEYLKEANIKAASKAIMENNGNEKYTSVNFHAYDNYVEFRSMGGDYIAKFPEIRNNVLRFAQALDVATDPNAYRKEYITKMYKLVKAVTSRISTWNEVLDDAIAGFAYLQAGVIDKDRLKNLLLQRAEKRKEYNDPFNTLSATNKQPAKPNLPK